MAIYQIVEIGSEVLREKSVEVKQVTPNIVKLIENMLETMYDADGVGLAAPQIGVAKRVIVIDVGEGPIEMVNPVIVDREGEAVDEEGCLSIPGVTGQVARATRVRVQGLDREGQLKELIAEDLLARAFQHEIDHLEGVLFVDKATKTKRK